MQCFGSVLVRLTEPLGSAEPPNLTEPLSSAEPEPVPERFGLPLMEMQRLDDFHCFYGDGVRKSRLAMLNETFSVIFKHPVVVGLEMNLVS